MNRDVRLFLSDVRENDFTLKEVSHRAQRIVDRSMGRNLYVISLFNEKKAVLKNVYSNDAFFFSIGARITIKKNSWVQAALVKGMETQVRGRLAIFDSYRLGLELISADFENALFIPVLHQGKAIGSTMCIKGEQGFSEEEIVMLKTISRVYIPYLLDAIILETNRIINDVKSEVMI